MWLGPVKETYAGNYSYIHPFSQSSELNTATKVYFQDHMLSQLSANYSQDKYQHTVEDVTAYCHTFCDKNHTTTGVDRETKSKGFCETKKKKKTT